MSIKKLSASRLNGNGLAHKNAGLKIQGNRLLNVRRWAADELFKNQWRETNQTLQPEKLYSNRILSSLPAADFETLSPHLELVSLTAGENLNKPCENINHVYFPEEPAAISQFQFMADGSTAEIVMVGSEGLIGLNSIFGSPLPCIWAQTISSGTAFRIKSDVLKREFFRSSQMQSLLLNYANIYIALISQRVTCNIRHPAEMRFCTWLLMLRDRTRTDEIRLTQEQIAVCLGINRPTVSTFAKSLRQEGIIDYARGNIKIINRRRLEAAACECYATVRGYLTVAASEGAAY